MEYTVTLTDDIEIGIIAKSAQLNNMSADATVTQIVQNAIRAQKSEIISKAESELGARFRTDPEFRTKVLVFIKANP